MTSITAEQIPLVVDLDGTLLRIDTLHESAVRLLRDQPLKLFYIPYWLLQGKAVLKHRLARHTAFDATVLPYNDELLAWLLQQRAQGQQLVLCTAADMSLAAAVSSHLAVFDQIIASDGKINLSGTQKAEALQRYFGHAGFDYAGNARSDLPVWKCARHAIVVNASAEVTLQAERSCTVAQVFPAPRRRLGVWAGVLRVHQWVKNLLLILPLIAAHQWGNVAAWPALIMAFVSFCLCASSVYIVNDLLDLDSDRRHPYKRNRPFACGKVPAWMGVLLAPLLLVASLAAAMQVNGNFIGMLLLYFVLTCAYSWDLKRRVLIDCLTLALLYTLRVVAGAVAAAMALSFWLLAFSVFLFLSLAFVKRYAELRIKALSGDADLPGRGYRTGDAVLVMAQGIASGYATVLVLALYLNSTAVIAQYRTPEAVWGAVPVILYWISRMWMQAHRGNLRDDPLMFAVRDKYSWLTGVALGAVGLLGAMEWKW